MNAGIVGSGLIARTLKGIKPDVPILFFASGVSNSGEKVREHFEREKNLLLCFRGTNKCLVYFSTCSIFDTSAVASGYISHKLEMEDLVKSNFENNLVLRLPTLVGKTNNPYTFFNYLKNCIECNKALEIQQNAWRYLFDADDLVPALEMILKNKLEKSYSINVAFPNPLPVSEIVTLMEKELGKTLQDKTLLQKGSRFQPDLSSFHELLAKSGIKRDWTQYTKNIIRKYCL